ncbi:hypothetical protein GCM10010441_22000 [Kitasatospora paracochleata]|uniref:Preprotein translocase subunit YajC n=1 Tax=Kitasatospora paracochleata TaxID=58354 RepID=A0ABT1J1V6_9ACTN|nr:potassium channel family protein [Kitasatospora paracochleata]MCP2311406.1 preprotein translocase subunit YajC [Kitasatospora paracochleata]
MRTPPALEDVPKRQRRLLVVVALLRPLLTATGLVTAYYLLPLDKGFTGDTVVGLALGLLAVAVLIGWQTWAIVRARYPRLRAVEALATTFPLFVLLFAVTYFLMERSEPGSFTQHLDRTDSLYFTITVFTTVGFGDIAAVTDPARITVTVQMVGDLILLGIAARVILGAVHAGLDRRGLPGDTADAPDAPDTGRTPPDEGDGGRPPGPDGPAPR